jgi:hypothetical protein
VFASIRLASLNMEIDAITQAFQPFLIRLGILEDTDSGNGGITTAPDLSSTHQLRILRGRGIGGANERLRS